MKKSPEKQLAGFLAKYTPEIGSLASHKISKPLRNMVNLQNVVG